MLWNECFPLQTVFSVLQSNRKMTGRFLTSPTFSPFLWLILSTLSIYFSSGRSHYLSAFKLSKPFDTFTPSTTTWRRLALETRRSLQIKWAELVVRVASKLLWSSLWDLGEAFYPLSLTLSRLVMKAWLGGFPLCFASGRKRKLSANRGDNVFAATLSRIFSNENASKCSSSARRRMR